MTKERWIEISKKSEITIDTFFEFYLEKGGYVQDIKEFESIFVDSMVNRRTYIRPDRQIQVTYEGAVRQLFKYYNSKFNI